MMKIALDTMGGDYAPQTPVLGAVESVKENDFKILLIGSERLVKSELDHCNYPAEKIEIVNATQQVDMEESVVQALRKRDSSMRVAYNLLKAGDASAVVSAGHSGAMLGIGKFVLKMIPGIDRPCIGALLPSKKGNVLLLDAGANMDCSPYHLLQFAFLGDVYAEHIHHVSKPRISLLNIGAEDSKGNELYKATHELLKNSSLNFVGNIEGKEFFDGNVDVVVADGFAGNILLKSVQGAANFVASTLREEIEKSFFSKLGALFMRPTFEALKKRIDYAQYGGAPLLGLKGVGVVCHGNSNPSAIGFGLRFAQWAAEANISPRVEEKISRNIELFNTAQKA